MKRSFTTLLVIALSACGKTPPPTVTGLVDATEVDVASKIPGRVKSLAVREGDRVQEGQELLTIESQEVLAKIDQVSAGLDAANAKLALARKGARREERDAAQRQLDAARHQADIAKKNFDRVTSLFASGAAAQAQMDDAQSKLDLARDQLAVAEAHAAIVQEGARPEELDALAALVRQGQGTLAEVRCTVSLP
jgi:HlyD family secretion protein